MAAKTEQDPNSPSTAKIGKIIIGVILLIFALVEGIKYKHGKSDLQSTSDSKAKYHTITTDKWTLIETEGKEFDIDLVEDLKWFMVVDGNFKKPIALPTSDPRMSIGKKTKTLHVCLANNQGEEKAQIKYTPK